MKQKKYSFSALARLLDVPVEDVRNCVMVEQVCTPERVSPSGEEVGFKFGDLYVSDKVTDDGVIVATINRGGDASRPNWTTIEAGQFFVNEADVDLIRARFAASPTSESAPKEDAKARRARLLEWRGHEEATGDPRGALERVVARERVLNPKADRGNIGKAIKKAREERAESQRAGHWWLGEPRRPG